MLSSIASHSPVTVKAQSANLDLTSTGKLVAKGEAIAIGMCVSAEIALLLGLCGEDCVEDHYEVIQAVGPPVFVPSSMGLDAIRNKMMFDKHFVQKPVMGLLAELGRLVHLESAGKRPHAWAIEDSVLVAALVANVSRRESVQLPHHLSNVSVALLFSGWSGLSLLKVFLLCSMRLSTPVLAPMSCGFQNLLHCGT